MRFRTTAILAVLLVALATFYYVYEIRQAPEREKATAVKDRALEGARGEGRRGDRRPEG